MALVNTPNGAPATPAQPGAPATEKDEAAFKAAKKAAAEKHREKQKLAKADAYKHSLRVRDDLQKSGNFDKLPKETQDWLIGQCVPPEERVTAAGGPSFFSQMFGDTPVVGQKVTFEEVVRKTYKGMETINANIKKWAAKGIEVAVEVNKADMLKTAYTIKKLA